MAIALVGVGSNLGERAATLQTAVDQLRATPWINVQAISRFSLENYRFILTFPGFQRALMNSLMLAIVSATAVMMLTSVISWIVVKTNWAGRQLLDYMAFLPIAIPGVVLGVSLIWQYITFPVPIYGTIFVLMVAYATKYLPIGMRSATGSMIQIHKELEEAAYTSGLPKVRTVRRVMVPLLRPTLLSVWIWTGLLVYREMTAAVFLISQDNVTLPAIVWGRWTQGSPTSAAAITVLMMVALMPLIVIAWRFARRSRISAEL